MVNETTKHDYQPYGPAAEWSDTFKCVKCGRGPWTYDAEDCMSAERLNQIDNSECISGNNFVTE